MPGLVGLEILFTSQLSELRTKADALVLAIHWTLVLNGLRIITDTDGGGNSSERLPSSWNDKSEDVYTFRYVRGEDESQFLVKIVFVDGILIVNVLKNGKETSSVSLSVNNFVGDNITHFESAYLDLSELRSEIEQQLTGIQLQSCRGSSIPDHTKDDTRTEDPETVRAPFHRPVPLGSSWPEEIGQARDILGPIGRGDLDPLGREQGGMLMDPRRIFRPQIGPGNLPRGAVPPGARFDPFGPPVPDDDRPRRGGPRIFGPGPDHLPPPGHDNMFL